MLVRVLNDLSLEGYLTKFAELIELCVSWSLKTLLACVVGINVIQGMISPAIDSVKRSILTRGAEAIPGVGDALGGMAESYWKKNRGRTMEGALEKFTRYGAIVFMLLTIALNVLIERQAM